MEHGGHRARMRERYSKQGLEGFAEHEALELLLFYAIPQKNLNPLAHRLIRKFGTLYGVLNASPQQLKQVEGIGDYTATFISLIQSIFKQAMRTREDSRVKFTKRQSAVDYCINLLHGEKREMFYTICLNGQMETIGDVLIAKGSLSDVPAYPRIVMDAVLTHNAHGVLLCHNHPSGTITPSIQDLETTDKLQKLFREIEVVLIDHMIVSENEAFSMVRNGLIKQTVTPEGVVSKVACSGSELQLTGTIKIDKKSNTGDMF